MPFLATTKCNTYRGTAPNAVGDDIVVNDGAHRIGVGWAISIIERKRNVQDAATGVWRTVRYAVGRLTPGRDVAIGDRIEDLTSSAIYTVDEVTATPRTIGGEATLLLDLRITAP